MIANPFIYGRVVSPSEFVGRQRELRLLYSRLLTGQHCAITGQPHTGKTSLLKCLMNQPFRRKHLSQDLEKYIFGFLDAQALRSVRTQAQFWELALGSLNSVVELGTQPVADAFKMAQKNHFGNHELESLFSQLQARGSRLILIIDEFDDFLSHPTLHSAEFYSSLRSLASCTEGLVLILAARRDVTKLNEQTQFFTSGSPYFNIFINIRLGPFTEKDLSLLLQRAGDRFDARDRQYVRDVSGRNPYLAQAAAASLWDAYNMGHAGINLYEFAGSMLYSQVQQHFADMWRAWSNHTRKAVTSVALAQIPRLIGGHAFVESEIEIDLADFRPELESLRRSELLAIDENRNWTVVQGAFLWWLTDELQRNVRDDADFKAWLQSYEMDGLLSLKHQQRMSKAIFRILSVLGRGATTLIDSFAKGLGEGLGKGAAGSPQP